MNPRPSGYEPDELPAAPPRGVFAIINIINQKQNFKFKQPPKNSLFFPFPSPNVI